MTASVRRLRSNWTRTWQLGFLLLYVLILPVVGVVAGVRLLASDTVELEVEPAVHLTYQVGGLEPYRRATLIALDEDTEPPAAVKARYWGSSGVVTALNSGADLVSIVPIVHVNAEPIFLLVGGPPPSRDLRTGLAGPDVDGLRAAVAATDPDFRVGAEGSRLTCAELTRIGRHLNAVDPAFPSRRCGTLGRGSFTWLPAETDASLIEWAVDVGDPAPSIGGELFATRPAALAVDLEAPDLQAATTVDAAVVTTGSPPVALDVTAWDGSTATVAIPTALFRGQGVDEKLTIRLAETESTQVAWLPVSFVTESDPACVTFADTTVAGSVVGARGALRAFRPADADTWPDGGAALIVSSGEAGCS